METNNLRFKEPYYVGQLSSIASHPLQDSLNSFPQSEQDFMSLTVTELKSDPLNDALSYFNRARKFYAELGTKRALDFVSMRVADLSLEKGDLETSNHIFKKALAGYQAESWPVIQKGQGYSVVSHKLLESARTLGRHTDVLRYLLEVMSLDPGYAAEAFAVFQSSMMNDVIVLDVPGEDRFMKVTTQFIPKHIAHFDSSSLEVSVESRFPGLIEGVSVELKFFESQYNRVIATNVTFEPGVAQTFTTQMLVKLVKIQSIELKAVVVHYALTELSMLNLTFQVAKTKLSLTSPSSKLGVEFRQSSPALIAEDYYVKITLSP